jgi:hypothetical protein
LGPPRGTSTPCPTYTSQQGQYWQRRCRNLWISFLTYSHPRQMQYSSWKICIVVYCLHKCSVHLVTWSHIGALGPTRVKDKGRCSVMLQTTYVVTHCRAIATPGCSRWRRSQTLCGQFQCAQYESNTPHHQWMDPILPGGNDRLHQSSEKLSMSRKTVDIEDGCFSLRKNNYGRIQLPGFLEMLSMSPASCSLSPSPTAPRTLCSTLSRHGFNVEPQSSQTAGLAIYACPRRHIHTTL